jgi:hypothetical protein
VIGAILLAIGLVIILPALVWAGVGLLAAGASVVLTDHAEATHPGSDLIETNV